VIGHILRTLERITRPPRRPFVDLDECVCQDGAEQLAEAEAERDVWDAETNEDLDRIMNDRCLAPKFCLCPECAALPNPAEPGLTDDELVAVREMLLIRPGLHRAQDRMCIHTSANGIDSEARCAVCRCIRHIVEQMTSAVGFRATDPAERPAGVSDIPPSPPAGQPFDWHGWAIPAICEVLAEHLPIYGDYAKDGVRQVKCRDLTRQHRICADWQAWREHVSPLIADRIGCDPAKAIAALQSFNT
jgi:hypothetical protein